MGCLPESGGCERQRTDPFVDHLNRLEGRAYRHELCLDKVHRNSPQPEALCVEQSSGDRLVIERKTISWPPDFIVRHANDHLVAEIVTAGLRDLTRDGPYAIVLDDGLVGTRKELERFAQGIVETVRARFPEVVSGGLVGSTAPGFSWEISMEDREEREFRDEPGRGLAVRWYPDQLEIRAGAVPLELLTEVKWPFRRK